MLKPIFIALSTVCVTAAVMAQVAMDLTLNRNIYMQYEPIFACVTLRNDSGRTLVFGNRPELQGYILFNITDQRGQLVPKRAGAQLRVTGLVLEPGQIKRMIVPINRYYQLDRTGVYRIYAYVSHSLLPTEYKSPDHKFNVEPGATVWKKVVGLPDLDEKHPAEVAKERIYNVRSLLTNSNSAYYLVVEDKNLIYAVIRLGKAVGYEKFTAEVDMLSRLHLLMPISPAVFHYLAFSPDGKKFADEYRKTSGTIPMLMRDPDTGLVTLIGGETARAGVDFTDPNSGLVHINNMTGTAESASAPDQSKKTKAPTHKGLVDLGKNLPE